MGKLVEYYAYNERFKDKVNIKVLEFIDTVTDFPDRNGKQSDNIDHLFSAGYCYYFAAMLREAFGGQIAWVEDRGHIVWVDTELDTFSAINNSTAYDITGVFTDYNFLWPISYLGGLITDFKHNGKVFHYNLKFKEWCDKFNICEAYAIEFIWGTVTTQEIINYFGDGFNLPQTAYQYWKLNKKKFEKLFSLRSEGNCLQYPRHEGIDNYLDQVLRNCR